ncbi:FtsB family cell division protein [Sediminitomix flava]|uniref:Septum formation initiator n=1 Tax=Sediminitomix flava TaxID=379075 RepID=A0A315ZCE3_SEDFL|nr:septum formation initiator family protein [Sediminitomix flava]PWJ42972.1 septum formation initiator [Sediminitomix flava]
MYNKLKELLFNLGQTILKNRYVLLTTTAFIWVLFFDSNSLLNRHKLNNQFKQLESEAEFYKNEIKELEKEIEALEKNPEALEKLAREKYLYQAEGETIYILKEKE